MFLTGPYLGNFAEVVAYADSAGPTVGNPVELQVVRASALYSASFGSNPLGGPGSSAPDTIKRNEAFRAFAAASASDSTSFGALFEAAGRLRTTHEDEALAMMKRAVSLSPRSTIVRTSYWTGINAQRGPTKDKQALIEADRRVYLAATDSAPWALATVIRSMRSRRGSRTGGAASRGANSRPRATFRLGRGDSAEPGESVARFAVRCPRHGAARAEVRQCAHEETLHHGDRSVSPTKPWVANPATRDQAVLSLFFEVRDDSTYPTDKIVSLVKRVVNMTTGGAPTVRYGKAARVLAGRKVEFPYGEQLAREGLKGTARYLNDFPGYRFTSVGDQADALDGANATMYDDLGFIYFNAGRYAEADKELTHALDLTKKNVTIYYDLGRLRAAQGRDEEAELVYAQGHDDSARAASIRIAKSSSDCMKRRTAPSKAGRSTSPRSRKRSARRAKPRSSRPAAPIRRLCRRSISPTWTARSFTATVCAANTSS